MTVQVSHRHIQRGCRFIVEHASSFLNEAQRARDILDAILASEHHIPLDSLQEMTIEDAAIVTRGNNAKNGSNELAKRISHWEKEGAELSVLPEATKLQARATEIQANKAGEAGDGYRMLDLDKETIQEGDEGRSKKGGNWFPVHGNGMAVGSWKEKFIARRKLPAPVDSGFDVPAETAEPPTSCAREFYPEKGNPYYVEFTKWTGKPETWTLYKRHFVEKTEVHPWSLGGGEVTSSEIQSMHARPFVKFMVDAMNHLEERLRKA